MLLKQLLAEGPASCEELSSILQRPIGQVSSALGQMAAEGFVREDGPLWQITPG
jgi:DNA-binding IclR family transcriptional regulator